MTLGEWSAILDLWRECVAVHDDFDQRSHAWELPSLTLAADDIATADAGLVGVACNRKRTWRPT